MRSLTAATILSALAFVGDVRVEAANTDYDFFIFAQTWPATVCVLWEDRHKGNTCDLPPKSIWTVHGLWPTKSHEIGPGNCRPDVAFNPDKIKAILPALEAHWTNIHEEHDLYGFWRHEWSKHGTCAMTNPALDNELKYFQKGVELNEKYSLIDMLNSSGIYPGQQYKFEDVFHAVRKYTGVNPAIQCAYDRHTHQLILDQIDICMDKEFKLIGCEDIKGGLDHGCGDRPFLYPTSMTTVRSSSTWWIVLLVLLLVGLGVLGVYFLYTKFMSRSSGGYERI